MTLESGWSFGLAADDVESNRSQVRLGTELDYPLSQSVQFQDRIGGVQYFGDTDNALTSQFLASDNPVPFTIEGNGVETQLELAGNLAYRHKSGLEFKFEAGSSIGDING